jgi:2-succinyl-5-enolpyruvyl-6-hydroxy-3-cyclohexene-1-carboxylate synthase
VIVDELARSGVRHFVVCPGSRNAPLSMAAYEAAAAGTITLHVRIDERSAGFLALGIGKSGAGPAAVCCTSGTAVANLHPAVLEAHHSRTPLVLLTADRPAELQGTGANQTIDQRGLYGPAAPCVDMPLAEQRAGANAVWRATVCRAIALATSGPVTGSRWPASEGTPARLGRAGGPVQINVPLREPLVPDGDESWPESLAGRANGDRWTTWTGVGGAVASATRPTARTVLVIGDPAGDPDRIRATARAAVTAGWPVIAEPTGFGLAGTNVLANGSLLINAAAGALPADLRPADVVVAGRPTLSRGVGALLRTADRVVVIGDPTSYADPQRLATEVAGRIDRSALAPPDPDWLAGWQAADRAAGAALDELLAEQQWPTGEQVAQDMIAALPPDAVLFLGSSNPVRYVDFAGGPGSLPIAANRGVAGIDGSVSTAAGIALGADRPCYALLGDLTFLHDINGLLVGPTEQRPNLTVVVLNDDGGGIFSLLEQGAPEHEASFERVFGTSHHADLAALCAGYRVPHVLVTDRDKLPAALAPAAGPRVVEIRTQRSGLRDWQATLFTAIKARLT